MKKKVTQFFKERGIGAILACVAMLLMVVILILYPAAYAGGKTLMDNMSWPSFYAIAGTLVLTGVFLVLFKGKFAGFPLLLGSLLGFVFFIYKTNTYLSAAIVSIDSQFEAPYIILFICYLLNIILGVVTLCFLFPTKKMATPAKALTSAGVVLLSIGMAGGTIANENTTAINKFLKTSSSKVVQIDGAEVGDTQYYKSKYKFIKDLRAAGQALNERVEAEGSVLLKNENNALPLKEGNRKVSLFSIGSVDPVYGGTGSGKVDTSTAPTFKQAFERNNLMSVNPTVWDWYLANKDTYKRKEGYTGQGVTGVKLINDAPWAEVKSNTGSSFASYGDAAIVVLSRVGGEGSDMPRRGHSVSQLDDADGSLNDATDGDYLQLSVKEKALLEGLKAEKDAGTFKSIVVLLNGANQIQADFLNDAKYGIDAALWIGTPGTAGLYGVAEVLAGNVNPSGKLSTTFWNDHHANPALPNFGCSIYDGATDGYLDDGSYNQNRVYNVYQEGIYLGYKYTETRYEDFVNGRNNVGTFNYSKVVTYPFGHGLSYTNFEYSNMKVNKKGNGRNTVYEIKVTVKNVGEVAGRETVQVYLQKPYGEYNIENGIEAASVELVGFAKTKELAKDGTEELTIEVKERQFASYDSNNAKTYVRTAGDYFLAIGHDSHDAINNILAAKNVTPTTSAGKMDAEGKKALVHQENLDFNKELYSTSEATNYAITNQFDGADWNKYANNSGKKVEYLTRNDWAHTVHTDWDDNVKLPWNANIDADQKALGVQGEVKLPEDNSAYPTMGAAPTLQLINLRVDSEGNKIAYDDPNWDAVLDAITWDEMVETIGKGMRHSAAITSIGKPECTDHNGPTGLTEKYSYGKTLEQGLAYLNDDPDKDLTPTCYPSSGILAATFDVDLMFEVGEMIGEDALWAGYAGLYGPGSNIQRTPYDGRNFEYYSEDGFLSGTICGYECNGMEYKGLYVYNKHCVLNEQEDMRRGVSVWLNEQTMREIYLRAFELPITMEGKEYKRGEETIVFNGASGVMVSFNRIGLYWSGMCKGLMTECLRNEFGMHGIAVTDMWHGSATPYMNAAAMLIAGTNLVDGGVKAAGNFDPLKTNHADVAWAMRESLHRILYTAVHSNVMNGISSNSIIVPITPIWVTIINTLDIVSGVAFVAGIGLTVTFIILERKQEPEKVTE